MSNDGSGEKAPAEESGDLQKALKNGEDSSPSDITESIPKGIRQTFEAVLAKSGPMFPPYLDKVSGDHITSVIDSAENDSKRSHFRILFLSVLASLLFLISMWFLAPSNPELFEKVVAFLLGAIGGGGAGYGIGSRSR